MECRSVSRNLTALLDGDLRPARTREIQQHLETCPACAAEHAEMAEFIHASRDAITYRGTPMTFASLRPRMAAIEPLEQVLRYQLPKLRIPGAVPRFAVAMLLLAVLAGVPYAFRHSRQVYTAARTPFDQREATLLAALDDNVFPGEVPSGRDRDIA